MRSKAPRPDGGEAEVDCREKLGVGLVAAGPAAQAIHLPTLGRLTEHFYVASVMDIDGGLASSVARAAGAAPASTLEELLENPAVEVVAICSPDRFHAEHVTRACAAGVRGILCEKPLASSVNEVEQIFTAVGAVGMPLVVGTMHVYDPVWLDFWASVGQQLGAPHLIRSTITLPLNPRMEDYASEITGRPPGASRSESAWLSNEDLYALQGHMRSLVLGLWIHDIPWIRRMAPQLPHIEAVTALKPFGGTIAMMAGDVRVQLLAYMRDVWEPDWRLEAWGEDWRLRIVAPPSYVHSGATRITFWDRTGERVFRRSQSDGYEAEWLELYRLVASDGEPRYSLTTLRDDLAYALAIASGATDAVRSGGAS